MIQIDKQLISDLYDMAVTNPRLRQNMDLRNSDEDNSQRMLNALMPGTVVPIHRHPHSNETVICLSGKLVEVIYEEEDIALLAVGSMVKVADEVRKNLKKRGYSCTLVNARFIKPIDEELIRKLCKEHKLLVTMEEHVESGGFGEKVLSFVNRAGLKRKVETITLADEYVEHGNVDLLKQEVGIDADSITARVMTAYVGL